MILFLLAIGTGLFAQDVTVDAVIDTAKLRIGEQAKVDLYLSYTAKKQLKVKWPSISDTLTEKVEVVSVSAIDTTLPEKSNSTKILQHQQIIVSVYDSGYFAIPGFKFVVDGDTAHPLYTKPLFLEVHTVPTDSSATKIKDIKATLNEPFNWRWYIEYLYWGLAIVAIIIGVSFWIIYQNKKRKNVVPEPEKPKIPPHYIALATLEKIRTEKIWQEGKIKEYYSAISDTVRYYIEERFTVNALESTTDEIMTAFRSQVVDKESKDKLQQLLTLSDLVKFAKQFPIEDEHNFTLQNAFDFVNGTKREEEMQLDETGKQLIDAQVHDHMMQQAQAAINQNGPVSSAFQKPSQAKNLRNPEPEPFKEISLIKTILALLGFMLLFLFIYNTYTQVLENLLKTIPQINTESTEEPSQDANLPVMLDAETRLDSIVVADNNTVGRYHTMVNALKEQLDMEMVRNYYQPKNVSEVKTDEAYKEWREKSATIEFYYNDKMGNPIMVLTVGPEDYLN